MRIILADHNRKSLWALRTWLEEEPEMVVVGEARNAKDLLSLVEKTGVDLVLIDGGLPGSDMGTLMASLHTLQPKPVVVGTSSNYEDGRMMLRAGADAFVSKGDQPDFLLRTLRQYAGLDKKISRTN